MILHIVFYTLLLGLVGFLSFLLKRSLERNRSYGEFYESTLEDVEVVVDQMNDLMHRRQLISDDPDVKNLYRTITLFHGILIGYSNANTNNKQRKDGQPK